MYFYSKFISYKYVQARRSNAKIFSEISIGWDKTTRPVSSKICLARTEGGESIDLWTKTGVCFDEASMSACALTGKFSAEEK